MKRIARTKKIWTELGERRNLFEEKMKQRKLESRLNHDLIERKKKDKFSIEKLMKNFKRKSESKITKYNPNPSNKKLGFLDKVKSSRGVNNIFEERKVSNTEVFKKNVQNQYFALRKFMRNKSREHNNGKSIQEKRESLRKNIKENTSGILRNINIPFLNNTYSIKNRKNNHNFGLRRMNSERFSHRFSIEKTRRSLLDDTGHLSELKKSSVDYELKYVNQKTSIKKRNNGIEKTLFRRMSNKSKGILKNEEKNSINGTRLSHGTIKINNLSKKIIDRLSLRKHLRTIEF